MAPQGSRVRSTRTWAPAHVPLHARHFPDAPAPEPQPAEDLQLYKGDAVLEDGKSLAEQRVENDDELAVAFRIEGEVALPVASREGRELSLSALPQPPTHLGCRRPV